MTALQPVLSNTRKALYALVEATQILHVTFSNHTVISRRAQHPNSSFRENQANNQCLLRSQQIAYRRFDCWEYSNRSAMQQDHSVHSAAAAATDLGSFGESRNTAAMLQSTPLQQDRNVQDMSSQQQQQQQIRCGNMQGQYTNECNEINAAQEQLPKQLQKQQDTNMQQTDWEDIAAAAAAQQQQGGAGQQQQSAQEQLKPHKPRPTHFVALRVSHSQQVRSTIASVQDVLRAGAPHLEPCLLEPVTAHLTIMVLHLPSKEQEDAAAAALADLATVLQAQQLLAPLTVQLQGLSSFRHQVLYLDVADGPSKNTLRQLAECVISHFAAAADGTLAIGEGRSFTPHVTVAKTSRLIGKQRKGPRGRTKISDDLWASAADVDAGRVKIQEIQICSMQGRMAGDYYRVTHRLQLSPPADIVTAAAEAAAPPPAAAATADGLKSAKRKLGPLAAARNRFRKLLSVLGCKRRSENEFLLHAGRSL